MTVMASYNKVNGLKSGKVKRSDLERSATRILRMIRANTEVPMRV